MECTPIGVIRQLTWHAPKGINRQKGKVQGVQAPTVSKDAVVSSSTADLHLQSFSLSQTALDRAPRAGNRARSSHQEPTCV
eukprot:4473037-Pleurochrysis_carterae.AAC.1